MVCRFTFDSHFDHFDESFIDLDTVFGGRLEIFHVVILFAPGLCLLSSNLPHILLVSQVDLVADKDEWETLGIIGSGILNKAILPLIKVLEGCWVR